MVCARVIVLPDPVTPSRVWYLSPRRSPALSSAMALGWSPAGENGAMTSKRVHGGEYSGVGVCSGDGEDGDGGEDGEGQTAWGSRFPTSLPPSSPPSPSSPSTAPTPAELREHLDVAVDVRLGVLHRQRPLLLVARGHEDPAVEQPRERRGEQLGPGVEEVAVVLHRRRAGRRRSPWRRGRRCGPGGRGGRSRPGSPGPAGSRCGRSGGKRRA